MSCQLNSSWEKSFFPTQKNIGFSNHSIYKIISSKIISSQKNRYKNASTTKALSMCECMFARCLCVCVCVCVCVCKRCLAAA